MQIHGGAGYAEETDVSRYFVDARVLSIFEGAEDVLALRVIARSLLKGREPTSTHPDKTARVTADVVKPTTTRTPLSDSGQGEKG